MPGLKSRFLKSTNSFDYSHFDKIDGDHPLKDVSPESVVEYPARFRKGGKVKFFNFNLAKEMGLIDSSHNYEMNQDLENKLLETFSLIIINEYDEIHDIKFNESEIKDKTFMATRYLQLQHPNKQGKTSGDGRSIWNGHWKHKNKTWDLSSCGTGATGLSPATHINNRFYQTGDPSVSYGCGYSELDEGLEAAFFSEILKKNHVRTERVLAVIEFSNKLAITVRAHENLLRPGHLFAHLKQGNYDELKKLTDYYIERQIKEKIWTDAPKGKAAIYRYFLDKVMTDFSTMAAMFEDEYIFCWLDWDGDNILMDGSIIDYGSVRQFGLFHSEYRYDDVERYSTSILEQKNKAKYIVQTFAQMTDYLITKDKKNLKSFAKSKALKKFEENFQRQKYLNLLKKIGFKDKDAQYILEKHKKLLDVFRKDFTYFERAKSIEGIYEVADGINCNAIFCMRDILRELPQIYLSRGEFISDDEFIDIVKSSYATVEDLHMTNYRKRKINSFQKSYWDIVEKVSKKRRISFDKMLLEVTMRSSVINKFDRVTGDSISTIVYNLIYKWKNVTSDELYEILSQFVEYQNLDPQTKKHSRIGYGKKSRLIRNMLKIVRTYREGL